jgi:hypothetical protein
MSYWVEMIPRPDCDESEIVTISTTTTVVALATIRRWLAETAADECQEVASDSDWRVRMADEIELSMIMLTDLRRQVVQEKTDLNWKNAVAGHWIDNGPAAYITKQEEN